MKPLWIMGYTDFWLFATPTGFICLLVQTTSVLSVVKWHSLFYSRTPTLCFLSLQWLEEYSVKWPGLIPRDRRRMLVHKPQADLN